MSEYDKPSRQNRRQKRGWKRKPQKSLDLRYMPWQPLCTVLNTPTLAVSPPVSHWGFFTSIGLSIVGIVPSWLAQWSGSAQLCNSLRVKAASRLTSVLKYPVTPQQGGHFNNTLGAVMANQKRTRAHSRFTVYSFIRRFTGPALAYRLAFAGRAV